MKTSYSPTYHNKWRDNKHKNLSPNKNKQGYGKLIFHYLYSNSEVGLTGIYELELFEASHYIGISEEEILETIKTEMRDMVLIEQHNGSLTIFVLNRFKLLPNINSPQVIKGVWRELNTLGKHKFKEIFIERYKEYLGKAYPKVDDDKKKEAFKNLKILCGEDVKMMKNYAHRYSLTEADIDKLRGKKY